MRRNPGGRSNAIRGPQSALTDFLASHNISANQIRLDYERRLQEAQSVGDGNAVGSEAANGAAAQATSATEALDDAEEVTENAAERKKRKRREQAALHKAKQSKAFKKRKGTRGGDDDGPDGDDEDLAWDLMYQKSRALPGQQENCEICDRRFTVTAYCKNGPTGGLLCPTCSKDVEEHEAAIRKKNLAKGGMKGKRRQVQSAVLDGVVQYGADSLLEICVKKVADNINDVDEFGDLAPNLLHRLSQILSKRRAMTPRTLQLFLKPELDAVEIYDCAKLETEDFEKIFAFMHNLEKVDLRCAGQIKDDVIDYLLQHNRSIKHLRLDSPNLVTDPCWQRLVTQLGPQLLSLRLAYMDVAFGDETIDLLARDCQNLRRLKLTDVWKPTNKSLLAISSLPQLQHLSLDIHSEIHAEALTSMVTALGPKLQTLSLRRFETSDDTVIQAVHASCRELNKLRITETTHITDQGIADLFNDWENPELQFIDFSGIRDIEDANMIASSGIRDVEGANMNAQDPDSDAGSGPNDEPSVRLSIGLGPEGFKAMMRHSGKKLCHLNVSSCRHITHAALASAFDGTTLYPSLQTIDVSLLTILDDFLVTSIFKCCPALRRLTVFACFNVKDVQVPKNVVLIGAVASHDTLEMEGNHVGEL